MAYTYNNGNSFSDFGDYWLSPLGITPIVVNAEAFILNFTGGFYNDGLHLEGGSYTVTVNGVVGTSIQDGIEFNALIGTSKLTIGTTGVVYGTWGVYALHPTTIINNGLIEAGTGAGIYHSGYGNYTITNTGEINSLGDAVYIDGSGVHTITNSSVIYSDTGLAINAFNGSGIEKLTNSGQIFGNVDLGSNNDTFKNTGWVDGNIYMGSGNDVFTGGIQRDFLIEESGKDNYNLGGGNDWIRATGFGANDGNIDTVNGGANVAFDPFINQYGDEYDASGATSSLFMNFDSVARVDVISGGPAYTAGTATGFDIGTDKVSNFESIYGGLASDVIFGSSTANYVDGGDGDDNLYGGGGNDHLYGGNGFDDIFGDAGRDYLDGGVADLTIDSFDYRALSDSTVAKAGRDVIQFFEDGFDVIDFSRLGLTSPFFLGVDIGFSVSPGLSDVRVLTTGSGWMVQLDKNGDAKIDLAIEVRDSTHVISWDSGDFVL